MSAPAAPHLVRRWSACLAVLAGLLLSSSPSTAQDAPDVLMARADDALLAGRVTEAVESFNRLVAVRPDQMPYLWQRGIALYFAGQYSACRQQFEAHRAVNPDDVENAAWHFLCVARESSVEKARAALLPVGPDRRSPMREVYEMFAGRTTPEAVIEAGASSLSGRFYAALYAGLFYDATGDRVRARAQIEVAAGDTFARVGGYMHRVAVLQSRRMAR